MSKRLSSKYKINRRYGVNLWGRAKSPVNVRSYGPGQHGQRQEKLSTYGLQLAAKQKLRGYYGEMTERQMRRLYAEADRMKGNTGSNLLGLLERRLDAVVYRMKLAPTVFAARQFVNHGHVYVNGKRVDISSYLVKVGDEISLHEKMTTNPLAITAAEASDRSIPEYITCESKHFKGKFVRIPEPQEIPYPFQVEIGKVIEWYSYRL